MLLKVVDSSIPHEVSLGTESQHLQQLIRDDRKLSSSKKYHTPTRKNLKKTPNPVPHHREFEKYSPESPAFDLVG